MQDIVTQCYAFLAQEANLIKRTKRFGQHEIFSSYFKVTVGMYSSV